MKGEVMSDQIKREDAMGAVQDHFNANGFKGYDDGQKMMDRIKALPSAEAVQGEWIDYIGADLGIEGQWLRDDGKTVFVQCDQCDSTFVRNLMTHMNFCPNCGAKMKGAEHETD